LDWNIVFKNGENFWAEVSCLRMGRTFGLGIFQANTYFQNEKNFFPKIPGPHFVDKRCVEHTNQSNTRSKRTGHKTIS